MSGDFIDDDRFHRRRERSLAGGVGPDPRLAQTFEGAPGLLDLYFWPAAIRRFQAAKQEAATSRARRERPIRWAAAARVIVLRLTVLAYDRSRPARLSAGGWVLAVSMAAVLSAYYGQACPEVPSRTIRRRLPTPADWRAWLAALRLAVKLSTSNTAGVHVAQASSL